MKKRKLLALVLAFVLCAGLFAGCGEGKTNNSKTKEVSVEEVKEEAETAVQSEVKEEAETAVKSEVKEESKAEETKEESTAEETKEESKAKETKEESKAAEPAEEVTSESLINGYFDTLNDIQSMSFNMSMNADMIMSMSGNEMVMKMTMDVYSETYGDNAYMKGSMEMEESGEKQKEAVDQYIMLQDGKYVTYSYNAAADSWTKYDSDKPAITKDLIPKVDVSGFSLEEEDSQYKISGSIDIAAAIESMGETFGSMFKNMAGTNEGITGEAKVEYFFNKETKALTAVHLDMSQALEDTFTSILSALFSSQMSTGEGEEKVELSAEDLAALFKVQVNSFNVNMDNIVINEGKEIVLPEAALNAAAES